MKRPFSSHTHFIYMADNIPDHRSKRYGCCPSQMAIRELQKKKPCPGGNPDTTDAK